jgi:hypothetical protein
LPPQASRRARSRFACGRHTVSPRLPCGGGSRRKGAVRRLASEPHKVTSMQILGKYTIFYKLQILCKPTVL